MGVQEHHRRTLTLPATLLLAVVPMVLVACGSSATIMSTVGSSVGDGGSTSSQAQPEPAASAASSAAPALSDEQRQLAGSGSEGYVPAIPRDDLKIVYTGSIQLVVSDLPTALARAKAAVLAVGGYIGASQESNDGDKPVATITYRIPASRWEDAIGDLRDLSTKVVAEQTQASEVGGQLVDLDARIRNLQASEASLQEIAKGTGKISDLLDVEAQLTDVRGQIEQLQGQQAQLSDQVAYGTMVATFGLEVQQVVETAKGWNPADDVDGATATLIGAGQTIVSGAIWFGIVWLPGILVVVILAAITVRLVRRLLPAMRPADPIAGWHEG